MPYIITVRVVPASSRSKVILDKTGNLKVYLLNQAQDGKANKELIDLFAKKLNIPKNSITIESGLTCRIKRLSIAAPIEWRHILVAFDIPTQLSIVSK